MTMPLVISISVASISWLVAWTRLQVWSRLGGCAWNAGQGSLEDPKVSRSRITCWER